MRDYSKVSPTFWTGSTGKALRRRGIEALVVGMYLMTAPGSNMLGLYYQPVLYMAHETGLGIEGASKGLQGCIDEGFCRYDEASEMVWVVEMAAYQIADELKALDKRCAGIQKDYDGLPDNPFLAAFFDRYCSAFHLTAQRGFEALKQGASEGPSEPHRSQEQEQEQEQEQKQEQKQEKEPPASSAARLPTCQLQAVVDLYHEVLPELPGVRVMDKPREKAIRDRWQWVLTTNKPDGSRRATTGAEALEWFRSYFTRARDNDFLMGRTTKSDGHANWRPDVEYLMKSAGLKQVLEKTATEST